MPIIDFNTDFNVQALTIEPYTLIDEVSATEFYIGTSRSFSNTCAPNWRIKRICQDVTVWESQFPNGDQGFTFVWDCRLAYPYG